MAWRIVLLKFHQSWGITSELMEVGLLREQPCNENVSTKNLPNYMTIVRRRFTMQLQKYEKHSSQLNSNTNCDDVLSI